MTVSELLPPKCLDCHKLAVSGVHKNCEFCRHIEFKEEVLCQLNRCIQVASEFKCHAFRPLLQLIDLSDSSQRKSDAQPKKRLKSDSIKQFFQSDKIKYRRALAVQKLSEDPDWELIDIKYHFSWNTVHRRPVFKENDKILDLIYDAFSKCNESLKEAMSLLWVAPDHIHLYVQSDGEHSIEEIVQEIKRSSQKEIIKKRNNISDNLQIGDDIWDEAYFAETIG